MLMLGLYSYQKTLDDYIMDKRGIRKPHIMMLGHRITATFVELTEFAAETERDKRLTEYVDVLHFLLSINNTLELDFMINTKFEDVYNSSRLEESGEIAILSVFKFLGEFTNSTRCFKYWSVKGPENKDSLKDKFSLLMIGFFSLGNLCKFTAEEVLESYKAKRVENFKRQEVNY